MSQGTPAGVSSVLGFKPCSAAAGTPTQAPRACTGRAGPAPAPRSSPAPPASTKPAQLSACPSRAVPFCGWSTKAEPPWLPGHVLDLCYVLTHFLPVVKSPPIHRLQGCLQTQTFKEPIFPAQPPGEAAEVHSELWSYPALWHTGCKMPQHSGVQAANILTGDWSQ